MSCHGIYFGKINNKTNQLNEKPCYLTFCHSTSEYNMNYLNGRQYCIEWFFLIFAILLRAKIGLCLCVNFTHWLQRGQGTILFWLHGVAWHCGVRLRGVNDIGRDFTSCKYIRWVRIMNNKLGLKKIHDTCPFIVTKNVQICF